MAKTEHITSREWQVAARNNGSIRNQPRSQEYLQHLIRYELQTQPGWARTECGHIVQLAPGYSAVRCGRCQKLLTHGKKRELA